MTIKHYKNKAKHNPGRAAAGRGVLRFVFIVLDRHFVDSGDSWEIFPKTWIFAKSDFA